MDMKPKKNKLHKDIYCPTRFVSIAGARPHRSVSYPAFHSRVFYQMGAGLIYYAWPNAIIKFTVPTKHSGCRRLCSVALIYSSQFPSILSYPNSSMPAGGCAPTACVWGPDLFLTVIRISCTNESSF